MRSAAITLSLAVASVFSVLWVVQHGNYKLLYCDSWLIENRQRVAQAELFTRVFPQSNTPEQHKEADIYLIIAASDGKLRFRVKSIHNVGRYHRLYVTTSEYAVHLGLLVLATALPSLFLTGVPWVRRFVRHRSGRCVRCGYNLHGLTEPRCPECGTRFGAALPEWDD